MDHRFALKMPTLSVLIRLSPKNIFGWASHIRCKMLKVAHSIRKEGAGAMAFQVKKTKYVILPTNAEIIFFSVKILFLDLV